MSWLCSWVFLLTAAMVLYLLLASQAAAATAQRVAIQLDAGQAAAGCQVQQHVCIINDIVRNIQQLQASKACVSMESAPQCTGHGNSIANNNASQRCKVCRKKIFEVVCRAAGWLHTSARSKLTEMTDWQLQ